VLGVEAAAVVAVAAVVAAPVVPATVVEAAVVAAGAVVAAAVVAAGWGVLVSVLPQAVNTRERIAMDAIMTLIDFFIESSLFNLVLVGALSSVA
jgi:hypothetical protein